MNGANAATTSATPRLNAQLIQNKPETCPCVILGCWTVALESPRSLNIPIKAVTDITIASRPKSRGRRSRPRTAVDSTCRSIFTAWLISVKKPPRKVRRCRLSSRWSVSKYGPSRSTDGPLSTVAILLFLRSTPDCLRRSHEVNNDKCSSGNGLTSSRQTRSEGCLRNRTGLSGGRYRTPSSKPTRRV